jgi:hypothetical protein
MLDTTDINLRNWDGFKPCRKKPIIIHASQIHEPFEVKTLEGILTGKAGDYLMIGVEGEKYPCAKEIFEKTYDFISPEDEDFNPPEDEQ